MYNIILLVQLSPEVAIAATLTPILLTAPFVGIAAETSPSTAWKIHISTWVFSRTVYLTDWWVCRHCGDRNGRWGVREFPLQPTTTDAVFWLAPFWTITTTASSTAATGKFFTGAWAEFIAMARVKGG